ncbi:unnamed protein product [Parascedosporium putredinis]|uniref:Uncharacterized protein n=1 Tax=Parascedosporium putredinis TaxID=1442378 RepID=A0A9P1MAQ6_9PEZI|nr:unnamed protein product [Parascedosporium putredinis]CAI7994791.1 unnamed protein product [Parascedosporium putredinis]
MFPFRPSRLLFVRPNGPFYFLSDEEFTSDEEGIALNPRNKGKGKEKCNGKGKGKGKGKEKEGEGEEEAELVDPKIHPFGHPAEGSGRARVFGEVPETRRSGETSFADTLLFSPNGIAAGRHKPWLRELCLNTINTLRRNERYLNVALNSGESIRYGSTKHLDMLRHLDEDYSSVSSLRCTPIDYYVKCMTEVVKTDPVDNQALHNLLDDFIVETDVRINHMIGLARLLEPEPEPQPGP